MNTINNTRDYRMVFDLCLAVSVFLLLLHSYYYCSHAFLMWQLMPDAAVEILVKIQKTGLFRNIYFSKIGSLVFMALSLMGRTGRKSEKVQWTTCLVYILIGAVIYFLSSTLLQAKAIDPDIGYMVASAAGYILFLIGISRLARLLPSYFRGNDPFGQAQAGFPQEERKITAPFSINLQAKYTFRDREKRSWINIVNARRGILIIGSPGCGKSWFIIEPCIGQLMKKGAALFIYDFKSPALTRLAYNLFRKYKDQYPPATAFYSINFSDISRSHRCNLLAPSTLQWMSDALGVSRTLLYSLNKTWIHKQGEFFVESPINFLAALIWFLKKYEGGRFCTLPHVIELAQVSYDKLFSILSLEPEVRTLISPFVGAFQDGIMDMLDSQVSSAKIPLARLASPDLYYILTGNDCSLDINDPAAPKVLCLGGDPPRQEALAPVLSLYIDQLNKLVNQSGKYPCALICDEFATVRAFSMNATMATARSNNIVPILAIQDINQLRTQYSREEADMILNIAGNVICGQVGGETALRISERFPKILRDHKTISTNSNDTSFSHSQQWIETITPARVATLSSGEFVGVVADDPDKPLELKAFHAKLIREATSSKNDPLPLVRDISVEEILQLFQGVKSDIEVLISDEMQRMVTDNDLRGFLVGNF
ncbi:YWFCY domain-containing protein [Flavitalea sp. BT771]|uniref:YWFCY domain-containing protein n=1 Tax=Flavitalea sp. BT771 TaxID=3063329 RepID=UPI0026E1C585|nr:YWFCY domain-containing protein [Flavitalea sp. BT771]MDO6433054.1 YWFCY domain-containing protein [Flavitalea sp. BT771]MDV6221670.1 YWFCY domain-containing protein [Flavitalea sp. BT771]